MRNYSDKILTIKNQRVSSFESGQYLPAALSLVCPGANKTTLQERLLLAETYALLVTWNIKVNLILLNRDPLKLLSVLLLQRTISSKIEKIFILSKEEKRKVNRVSLDLFSRNKEKLKIFKNEGMVIDAWNRQPKDLVFIVVTNIEYLKFNQTIIDDDKAIIKSIFVEDYNLTDRNGLYVFSRERGGFIVESPAGYARVHRPQAGCYSGGNFTSHLGNAPLG